MSSKSRNNPERLKRYALQDYLKVGLTVTQAKAWRRAKLRPPVTVTPKETAPGAPLSEVIDGQN